MIDPRIIKLLDSNDAETRKKAVKALAKTQDPQALPHLARVYREDRDPEVRELAKKGGLFIKKAVDEAPAPAKQPADAYGYEEDDYGGGGRATYDYGEDDDDDDSYGYSDPYGDDDDVYDDIDEGVEEDLPLPSEIRVSKANEDLARSYINQAMDWNVRGDDRKATQFLQRALKADPRLAHDSYTKSLASSITGLEGQQAVRSLTTEKSKQSSGGGGGAGTGEVTWGDISIDLAIYMLVTAIGIFAILYLLFDKVDFASIESDPGFAATDFDALADFGIVALATGAFITGIFSVFSLLVQGLGIHFAAISFMGGDGTYKGLLRQLTPFSSIISVIMFALVALTFFLLPDVSATTFDTTTTSSSLGALSSGLSCLTGIAGLVSIFFYSRLIGRVYSLSTLTGCFTFFIGAIIAAVFYGIFSCGLNSLLISAFGAAAA